MIENMDFPTKINKLLKLKGLTQRDVVRALTGVSKDTVNRWFTGKTVPRLDEAFRLAKLLECSVDFLADDSKEDFQTRGMLNLEERALLDLGREIGFEKIFAPHRGSIESDEEFDFERAFRRLQSQYMRVQINLLKRYYEPRMAPTDEKGEVPKTNLDRVVTAYESVTERQKDLEASRDKLKVAERKQKEAESELHRLIDEPTPDPEHVSGGIPTPEASDDEGQA